MNFKQQFQIGDVLEINESKDSPYFYETRILAIDCEKGLFVVNPINKELTETSSISAKYEVNDIVFIFNSKILGFSYHGHRNILVLKMPKVINRFHRRDFYNLPLSVPVSLKNSVEEVSLGQSVNISGLNICVELDTQLYANEIVKITIPFTKDFVLENISGIVKKYDRGAKLPYRYEISFGNESSDIKDQIMSHIFKVQNMLLKISENM